MRVACALFWFLISASVPRLLEMSHRNSDSPDLFLYLSVAADATMWMDPVWASLGKVTVGHPTSLNITLSNPTGSSETFTVSVTKFTPDTFGGTVSSDYDAGTLSSSDDRITVPGSVKVPANSYAAPHSPKYHKGDV